MIPSSNRSTPFGRPCIASLLASLLLAGCGRSDDGVAQPDASVGHRAIACGPAGQKADQNCDLQVSDDKGNLRMILRRPDGGFRRLIWPKGGELALADGAERLEAVRLPGGGVEARVGGWAYRIERDGGGLP